MKTRVITARLCTVILTCTTAFTAFTDECTTNGVTWTYTPDADAGTAFVTYVSCSGVDHLEIPYSLDGYVVTSLDAWLSFENSVKSITIPSGVSVISADSFVGFGALESFIVSSENSVYSSKDGLLLSDAGKLLRSCPPAKTSAVIPDTVTTIVKYAFRNCTLIDELSIPASVASIEQYAFFSSQASLKSFTVDEGSTAFCAVDGNILSKDGKTFVCCPPAATELYVPGGVESIASYAAASCSALSYVQIPASVTAIGESAFASCSCLDTIEFLGDAPETVGTSAFYRWSGQAVGYVPEGASGWPAAGSEWNGIVIELIETPDESADLKVVTSELLEKVMAAQTDEFVVTLASAKNGYWYTLYTADTVAGLAAAEGVTVQADSLGATFPVVKGDGGSMFFKLVVSTE